MNIPLLDLKAQYSTIKNEIKAAIDEVLESQYFILGPKVEQLENQIAQYCNTRYAVGVASGTDALLLSLMAIDITYGDEVITTPYTFFATAGSISRLGARPVFVDIDPGTYNINPELIEEKITSKTKVIIPVHLFGQCSDMDAILEIAENHHLEVIEDAAQAIGAEYKGRKAGSMGTLGCLSFFPSKNLGGYGDGGMVVTDDAELAEKVRVLRAHGSKPKYYHSMIGCNSRLDALQAAVLSVKLKYLDTWTQKRRQNAELYNALFSNSGRRTSDIGLQTPDSRLRTPDFGLRTPDSRLQTPDSGLRTSDFGLPHAPEHNYHVYNQYTIRVKNRDGLEKHLKSQGIGCALYYPLPLHQQKCYANLMYKDGDFPESEKAAKETISIPVYPELSEAQQEYVVKVISDFVKG